MDKNILLSIITDQRDDFFSKKKLIQREVNYSPYIKTGQIVVITGARRCGKSSLLWLLHQSMKTQQENSVYFNGDDERLQDFSTLDFSQILELHQSMFDTAHEKERVYFFDEIQYLYGWEKFLTRLYEKGNKIFVTGSSANLLSSEIASSLTGRYMELSLNPFSFSEYLRFIDKEPKNYFYTTKEKGSLIAHWENYFKMGGFPLVHKEKNINILKEYYQAILYRDIVARYKINQIEELKKIGLFLFSNTSKLFSYKTLQNISGLGSLSTVKRFLEYWENAFIF
ncbi:MAG: ATP-binding protein, partial [Spirochaetales bacterium]|nr:ATP-binding protein [Spirochaetales bacterium]